jgi:pimeloyl-ACP methyl ester carboxylesterase
MDIKTRRIQLPNGIALHTREGGQGSPTTLLVHGWAVPGGVWEPVLARWPDNAGRVIAPDLRGTGWSSKPREGYGLEDDVADIVALIDTLELRDVVLVGHSKGGAIAQRVALERPDALRSLVLVCPVPASGVPLDDGTIGFFRSLCGHAEGAAQIIGMMLAKPPVEPQRLTRLVDSMASVALESQLGGFDAWRTANFADKVGAIKTPTLVIGGGAETVLSPALLQQEVVARIPGSRLHLIEGAGHYPQIEAPDELTRLLVAAAG